MSATSLTRQVERELVERTLSAFETAYTMQTGWGASRADTLYTMITAPFLFPEAHFAGKFSSEELAIQGAVLGALVKHSIQLPASSSEELFTATRKFIYERLYGTEWSADSNVIDFQSKRKPHA